MIKVYLYPISFMITILEHLYWTLRFTFGYMLLTCGNHFCHCHIPKMLPNSWLLLYNKDCRLHCVFGPSLPSVVQCYCYWNSDPVGRVVIIICNSSADILAVSTHLPLSKMATISQTIYLNKFSWTKSFVYWFEFPWRLVLRVQLTISQHCFR